MATSTLLKAAAPYNPRREMTEREMGQLRASMTTYGVVQAIVYNSRTKHVVGGHKRILAAEAEGLARLPVTVVDLSLRAEKKLNLALNRIGQDLWDEERRDELIQALDHGNGDLFVTGFSEEELDEMLGVPDDTGGETDPDATPAAPKKPVTNPGDLWILGDHSLSCLDASEWVSAPGVDVVIADPPYGIGLDTDYSKMPKTTRGFDSIEGDDHPFDARPFRETFESIGHQFWFGADYYAGSLGDTEHAGSWLVWDKRVEEKFDAGFGSSFELIWTATRRRREILRHQWFQNHAEDSKEATNRQHPTQKPTALLRELLEIASLPGHTVLDPFAGSGSTIIACEQLKRRCVAIEISPGYCDVAVKRWEEFTGQKAERA